MNDKGNHHFGVLMSHFLKKYIYILLTDYSAKIFTTLFDCAGLRGPVGRCAGFPAAEGGRALCLQSWPWARSSASGPRAPGHRLTSRGAWTVAPGHVGSPWTTDRTWLSCTGRRILYHWDIWEDPRKEVENWKCIVFTSQDTDCLKIVRLGINRKVRRRPRSLGPQSWALLSGADPDVSGSLQL